MSTPRISVNALTQYLSAPPDQRRRIVALQKQPATFMVNYYEPAANVIAKALCDLGSAEAVLSTAVDELYSRSAANDFDAHRLPNNAEAVDAFATVLDDLAELIPDTLTLSRTSTRFPKLQYHGVDVSVFPEVTIRGSYPRHGQVVGGINLFFAKDERRRLDGETARVPSALISELLALHGGGAKVIGKLCLTADVFGGQIHAAPVAYKTTMRRVSSACEEIAMWWDRV
ncbi:MAG: hypothetical protein KDK08_18465 [Rhizobiaceae bacterium]|nr:hypothetical protein [Rhizobiaceae bacterium]MCB9610196.1 hypothetical protein [Polyangiaceae bacterium]